MPLVPTLTTINLGVAITFHFLPGLIGVMFILLKNATPPD
jgi:hypothetical protein